MLRYLLLCFCLAFSSLVVAQCVLSLKPRNLSKSYYLNSGDIIKVKLKEQAVEKYGTKVLEGPAIFQCQDSIISIQGYGKVLVEDVAHLSPVKFGLLPLLATAFKLGGGTYFLVNTVNRTVNKEGPIINQSTWLVTPIGFIGGYLFDKIRYKRYYFNRETKKAELKNLSPL